MIMYIKVNSKDFELNWVSEYQKNPHKKATTTTNTHTDARTHTHTNNKTEH